MLRTLTICFHWVNVLGDSLVEIIGDGDMILIDRGQRDIISGKIYLIGINDEVLIKRLEMRPGGNVLIKELRSVRGRPGRHPHPWPRHLDS